MNLAISKWKLVSLFLLFFIILTSPINIEKIFTSTDTLEKAWAECGEECHECRKSKCQEWNFSTEKCVDTCPTGKVCRERSKKYDACKWMNNCPPEGCGEGFCLVSPDTCEPCEGPSSSGRANGCSAGPLGNDPCSTDPTSTGSCDFEIPCNNHDRCYGSCGEKKTNCDSNFGSNAMDVCSDKEGENKEDCEWWADQYENAVESHGRSAYIEAQRGDCC